MTPRQSEKRARQLLRAAGLRYRTADPAMVLAVFRAFAAEAVTCEDQCLMFQADDATFGSPCLDFIRAYSVPQPGGAAVQRDVHLQLDPVGDVPPVLPETRLCSWAFPTAAAFLRAVTQSEAYRAAVRHPR